MASFVSEDATDESKDEEWASIAGEEDGQRASGEYSSEGKSSVFASAINLSNTILGAGVLAMPYACTQLGIVFFAVMLIVVACAAHLAIKLLVLAIVKTDSPELVNAKYTSLGNVAYGKWGEMVSGAAVVLQQLGPCVMYIQLSSDLLVPILCQFGGDGIWCNATFWKLVAVVVVIFPIALIRKMDSLKYISGMAVFCILAFAVAVVVRGIWVLCDTSLRWQDYQAIEANWATTNASAYPQCGTSHKHYQPGCYEIQAPGDQVYLFRADNMLAAFPVLCFAFLCHQNMFPVYEDLHRASYKRMEQVSLVSMVLCVSLYFGVGVLGYLIFLESNQPNVKTGASGDVLTLFSAKVHGFDFDLVMDILRVGYGVNLILSYPVMLFELRHVIEKYTVGDDAEYSLRRHLLVNFIVISICTVVAIQVESVGTMFGLIGSTTSPAIVFILPAAFYLKLRPDGKARPLAWLLGTAGVILVPVSLWSWASGLGK